MSAIDFSKLLFRCHRIGDIMTEPRSKSESLSQTCKTYLRQLYREKKYGRKKDIIGKYIEKGLLNEEDEITLYSRVTRRMYKKNTERINNEWLTGEPDLYEGESIRKATKIIDLKGSWDLFTLPFPDDTPDKDYGWQGQSYMDLSGAETFTLAHTLCDTPLHLIRKEIDSIKWRTGIDATPEQIFQIERNMKFSDIPMNERVVEFVIPRDDAAIQRIHDRVEECREYLIYLDQPKIISI